MRDSPGGPVRPRGTSETGLEVTTDPDSVRVDTVSVRVNTGAHGRVGLSVPSPGPTSVTVTVRNHLSTHRNAGGRHLL